MSRAHPSQRRLAANRKARHDYQILEKLEAGIVLLGTEVKSAREGKVQLKDAYVEVVEGEAYLVGAHISPYSHGNRSNHDPERRRKLLLKRREPFPFWQSVTGSLDPGESAPDAAMRSSRSGRWLR